jgi:hypothetical protein
MVRFLVAMLAALALSGCAGQYVQFAHPSFYPDPSGETRIFMDARGDLYPRGGLDWRYAMPDAAKGSLFNAARGADPALCRKPQPGSELATLCKAVEGQCPQAITQDCFDRWQSAQSILWAHRSDEVMRALGRDGLANTTLGVLIHGFNNLSSESQANFALAQKQMRRFAPSGHRLHFIEVYWDGCKNLTGVGCWGRAQASGPLAGFALRQMFNGVERRWMTAAGGQGGAGLHWRILTHSSGAFVAGAVLANPAGALPLMRDPKGDLSYERFRAQAAQSEGDLAIPRLGNAKLGMFAPATMAETFIPTPELRGLPNQPLTILSVVQSEDKALTKMGIGCDRLGKTCFGQRPDGVKSLQKELAAQGYRDVRVAWYDFTRRKAEWGAEWDLHDFAIYLRQAADDTTFLRDLMDPCRECTGSGKTLASD